MQNDISIVRQSSWTAGAILQLTVIQSSQHIHHINKALLDVSSWITKNSDSKLYIGKESLSRDFLEVATCWNSYKKT
jgi:hypothetical protein